MRETKRNETKLKTKHTAKNNEHAKRNYNAKPSQAEP